MGRLRLRWLTSVVLVALLWQAPTSATALCDLDSSFDGDGIAISDRGSSVNAIAAQPDGKVVAAGVGFGDAFALARFDADGSLDESFGVNGFVYTDFNLIFSDEARDVALQGDGRIVAAGSAFSAVSPTSSTDVALARYLPDGSLDPSFGGDGLIATDIGSAWDVAWSVVVQPDEKIVVGGHTGSSIGGSILLIRYQPDGSLDSSFGRDGIVIVRLGNYDAVAYGLALQADGKLVVVGSLEGPNRASTVWIARFTTQGRLDPGFGRGGRLIGVPPEGNSWFDVAIQADGKLVAGGDVLAQLGLARYQSDGSLDQTFGAGGFVVDDFPRSVDAARGVAVRPDGRIVVAGYTQDTGFSDWVTARHLPDGSLDPDFGTGGLSVTTLDPWSSAAHDVALLGDGRFVAGGWQQYDNFLVARYLDCVAP